MFDASADRAKLGTPQRSALHFERTIVTPTRRLSFFLSLAQALTVILTSVSAKLLYIDRVYDQGPLDTLAYLFPALALAVTLHVFVKRMKLNEVDSLAQPTVQFGSVWGALILAFLVLVGGMYLLKVAEDYSRGWLLTWFALSAVALVIVRWATRYLLRAALASGRAYRRIALYGTPQYVNNLKSHIEREFPHAAVTGVFVDRTLRERQGVDLSASLAALQRAMAAGNYDKVIIGLPAAESDSIRTAVREIAPFAPEIMLCTNLEPLPLPLHGSQAIGRLRADIVSPVPEAERNRLQKRLLDGVVAIGGLTLLSPLLVLIALAIKLESRGPVFFRQRRYGRNNQMFYIFKFRSMRVAEDGAVIRQAEQRDPRVTRVGRILRATSLDEVPQLINVLLGHMSVVGPRPHALAHEETFDQKSYQFSRRRRVLPGITGWAQVNGYRGETKTDDAVARRMEYDLYYIDNWSIWFDVEIIVRTLLAIFRGAY